MFTLQKLSLALVGTVVAMMSANPASAMTVSLGSSTQTSNGIFSSVSGAKTINFDNGIPTTGDAIYTSANGKLNNLNAALTGVSSVAKGLLTNLAGAQAAAPAGDTSQYLAVKTGDNVTISFAQQLNYFGLDWGSIDAGNLIFFYNGSTLVNVFTGSQIPGTDANGNQTIAPDNTYVNFFANSGETFNTVVLVSTGVTAFESDNQAYRVATPESSSMLGLLAFGALGAPSILKRKQKQIA